MKTVFATFNFKKNDLAAAEKLYIENHVRLTLQLPGLRQYITGLIRPHPQRPSPYRAAFNYFDDTKALQWALHKSPAAKPILQDGADNLRVNRWLELDSEIIVPFEARRPGLKCFVLAAEFELNVDSGDLESSENRYLNYQVEMTRRLPDLRHYMISKYQLGAKFGAGGATPGLLRSPLRMAMLVFDGFAALREAYRSPIGQELRKEEQATLVNARLSYRRRCAAISAADAAVLAAHPGGWYAKRLIAPNDTGPGAFVSIQGSNSSSSINSKKASTLCRSWRRI